MIKDSGERTEFSTGAVRDMKRGVGRMDLLPWYGIMEVSKHCEEGAEKYGEHNVDKGIPLHSLCDSAARHLAKFIAGETDEDHLRAAAWNLLWALNQRKTHPELDDLYSHKEAVKEAVEKVRNITDEFYKAKTNGEVVFEDGPDTINEECEIDIRPLTRDEILQRSREVRDVYVVSKFEIFWSGWCYLSFALPNNEEDPLSVFMYPVEGEGHKPFLYAPEKFEVYDAVPYPLWTIESLKEANDYYNHVLLWIKANKPKYILVHVAHRSNDGEWFLEPVDVFQNGEVMLDGFYFEDYATDVFQRAKLKFYKFDPNNLSKEEI